MSPKILESCNNNKLEFLDGDEIRTLYYADPTTDQRLAYSNRMVKRKGNKIKHDLNGTRLAGGFAVCTGMGEGDFALPANNEQGYQLISSDPKSKDYKKDWKKLLYKHQADYLMILGAHAFEKATVDSGSVQEEDEIDSLDGDIEDQEQEPALEDNPPGDAELGK